MLVTAAVSLAISAAKGIIKLSGQLDKVYAEKEAVKGLLAMPMPDFQVATILIDDVKTRLRDLMERTVDDNPDPLGDDRAIIENALDNPANNKNNFYKWYQAYFPDEIAFRTVSFSQKFKDLVEETNPDWADDPDIIQAFYSFGSGEDDRRKGYTWRIALIVVDTLVDFGAENSALFIRDEKIQSVVGAVLSRFGSANVQEIDTTSGLLKAVLAATLNGALDAREKLNVDNAPLNGLMDALVELRTRNDGDNVIMGLINGEGYTRLVSTLVEKSAELLDDAGGNDFKKFTSTYLKKVAVVIDEAADEGTGAFFKNNWGDLLRAGFSAVEVHGPAILSDKSPVVQNVLLAIVGDLSKRENKEFLSPDILVGVVDVAISAAVLDPDIVKDAIASEWLETLVLSVSSSLADEGIRSSLSKTGLNKIIGDSLGAFAANPNLLANHQELPQVLLSGVLQAVSKANSFAAEALGSAAIGGALDALSQHPELLDFKFSDVLIAMSTRISKLVKEKRFTRIQGEEILGIVSLSIAENPKLFLETESRISQWVVDIIAKAANDNSMILVAGAMVPKLLVSVLKGLAKTGSAARSNHAPTVFKRRLEEVIIAGLERAGEEVGKQVSASEIPDVIQKLVEKWAKGELPPVDPNNENFRLIVSDIIAQITA